MLAARFHGTASTIGVLIDAGTDIDYLDNVSVFWIIISTIHVHV